MASSPLELPALPATATDAWQAYNAMEATKQRHFAYLKGLEARYKKYGSPKEQEQATLNRLLQDHDTQVRHFARSMAELKQSDAHAHKALLSHISAVNSAPATAED
ncbi:MAG: hypothetical protein ACR2RB_05810 [Gammaproteobacteria bacterium]